MLLIDTQIVIWLSDQVEKISPAAIRAIRETRESGGRIAVAGITLYEIAAAHRKEKIELELPVDVFLEKVERHYPVLALDRHVALQATRFSDEYPKDPADRQIGATALVHGLKLVTADGLIRKSGEVPTIW